MTKAKKTKKKKIEAEVSPKKREPLPWVKPERTEPEEESWVDKYFRIRGDQGDDDEED